MGMVIIQYKKTILKYILILFMGIGPFFVGHFIKEDFFSFAGGSTDSWISFWGSYGGALIGALTVYLVTSLQIKSQRDLQIQLIKTEHDNAINRENRSLYLNQQYEKIEDSFAKIDEIILLYTKLNNSVSSFVFYRELLKDESFKGIPQEQFVEKEIKNKIDIKKGEAIKNFELLVTKIGGFSRTSLYIEDIKSDVNSITSIINSYLEYYDLIINEKDLSEHIKEHGKEYPNGVLTELLKNVEDLWNILNSKLKEILDERKEVGKYKQ